jgi:hypothetical protein
MERIEKTVDKVNARIKLSIDNVDGDINQLVMKQKRKEAEKVQEKNLARLR